jgi:hypothetical protein
VPSAPRAGLLLLFGQILRGVLTAARCELVASSMPFLCNSRKDERKPRCIPYLWVQLQKERRAWPKEDWSLLMLLRRLRNGPQWDMFQMSPTEQLKSFRRNRRGSSFVELWRGFAGSRQGDARGWVGKRETKPAETSWTCRVMNGIPGPGVISSG